MFKNMGKGVLCKMLGGIIWTVGSGDIKDYATDHSISEETVKEHIREYLNGNAPATEEGKNVIKTFCRKVKNYARKYRPITEEVINEVMKERLNQKKAEPRN